MNKHIKLSVLFVILFLVAGVGIATTGECCDCYDPCNCECPPEPPCPPPPPPPCDCQGVGTPGYWKNHFEAWPLDTICFFSDEINGWGTALCVPDEPILGMMKEPVKGNKCVTMLKALVSAKLNVASGCSDSCISDTIEYADNWFLDYCWPDKTVKGSSLAWYFGEPLYLELDDYNNGKLCAPARD